MAAKQTDRQTYTHFRNAVPLVWGSLRLAPTIGFTETLCRLCAYRAHIHAVLSHKTPLQQQFYSEYLLL